MKAGLGLALAAQAAKMSGQTGKLKVDAYSRHLQWLRTPDEVAEAVIEMGFDGIDLTVRPYPGHVDPAKVTTDLPPFVNAIRKHGIRVDTITCPITDADSPNAEAILSTASQLGIRHYWWGTFRYDTNTPVMSQLDALKPRVEKLAKLNEKYRMKAMYHTYSGSAIVGAALWDFLYVLRNFDPAYVSFHYDLGHQTTAGGGGTWALSLRAAGPYIGGVSLKDQVLENALVVNEGGPFTGSPAQGGRGGGVAGRGGRGGSGGRGAAGAGGLGGGPAGGRGGSPGGNATPATWRERQVPLGTGMDNLPLMAQILKEINFSGPVEIQAEYPNGGAESAQDRITLPRAMVLGAMKRDLLNLKSMWATSGLL